MQYCEIRFIFGHRRVFSSLVLLRIIRQIRSLKPPGNDAGRNVLSIFPDEVCVGFQKPPMLDPTSLRLRPSLPPDPLSLNFSFRLVS